MVVRSIELANFRSYARARFELGTNLTLVTGPNGSGKTNLLEGLYIAATSRSWRARDPALISHGQDFYRLLATLAGAHQVEVRFNSTPPQKQLLLNQKPKQPANFIGAIQAVLFEPQQSNLIYGGPDLRRRWLDQVLSTTDRRYLKTLQAYRRVLGQRNRLLGGRNRSLIEGQIFAWDLQLVELATYLVKKRRALVKHLNQSVGMLYHQMTKDKTPVEFSYQPTPTSRYAEELLRKLTASLDRDIRFGHTTLGPHRDDLLLVFNGRPAALTASRGEGRSLILASKLAEVEWKKQATRQLPIALLDDVFSELDLNRRRFLVDRIKQLQVIITATDKHGLGSYLPKDRTTIDLGKSLSRGSS